MVWTLIESAPSPGSALGLWLAFVGTVAAAVMSTIAAVFTHRTKKDSTKSRDESTLDHDQVADRLTSMEATMHLRLTHTLEIMETKWDYLADRFDATDKRLDDFNLSIRRLQDRMDNRFDNMPSGRMMRRPEGGDDNGIRSQ